MTRTDYEMIMNKIAEVNAKIKEVADEFGINLEEEESGEE